jgi:hypothetical protein
MTRLLSWVAAVCSLALFLPLTRPLFTGRILVSGDMSGYHVPMRHLYQQALHARELLLWTPAVFAGYYLHGEGQVGMLHPLHLVLYSTLPLDVAFNLEVLSSYMAAFAGMFWLLRRLRLATPAALFGSMLFAFSGFQVLHVQHVNVVAVVAHIPWLLAFAHLLVNDESGRRRAVGFAGVAIVLASAVLLGFPQAVWWNVLALCAFAPLFSVGRDRRRALVLCGAAACAGILLGGIQLLPTIDMVRHSVRAHTPRDFALSYSLHPWNVVQLWSPYVFTNRAYSPVDYLQPHEFGIYSGAMLTIAPLWLWIRRDALAPRRTLLVGAAVFAALMLVLAFGRFGRLGILLTYLPGIGSMRAPARYIVLVQFTLVLFAAIAFDDLVRYQKAASRLAMRDWMAISAVGIASVLTPILLNTRVLPVRAGLPLSTPSAAAFGTLFVTSVTVATLLAARRVSWALALLVGHARCTCGPAANHRLADIRHPRAAIGRARALHDARRLGQSASVEGLLAHPGLRRFVSCDDASG